MKKLVSFLIIAMLAMSTLASCSFLSGLIGGKEDPIEYDLEGAKEYLVGYFEDESTTTPSDYEVPAQIPVGDYNYQITWTVDRQDITITVANGMAKIDLNEKTPEEITYTLTATIADGDGKTTTYTRTCTIPAYNVISFEDYMAAEKGATVTVEGIVVAMNGKSVGNSRNHLFLADASGKGGYYCYQLDDDPVAAGVEIGMTVTVTATVEPYSGMQETKGGTFAIVSTEKQTVAVKDITDTFKNGGDLKNLVGLVVTIKGVEIKEQDLATANSQYLYFELNGERGYVRTYITDFPHDMSHEVENNPDKIAIDTAHAEKYGWSANVTGILILYNGAPYLIPMGTDCFEYLAPIEKTDEQKLAEELDAIVFEKNYSETGEIDLALTGKYYPEVAISYESDNAAAVVEGGKLKVTVGDDAVTANITVTATLNGKTNTKTVAIKLSMIPTPIKDISALEDGVTVIVKGVVVEAGSWSDKYSNMDIWIYDGTGKIQAFRTSTQVKVGDQITLKGKVGSYNGKKQIAQGSTSVVDVAAPAAETTLADILTTDDGVYVMFSAVVAEIKDAWSDKYGNISVWVTDTNGANRLQVYRATSPLEVGDTVTFFGKVGSYNGVKQIAQGAYAYVTAKAPEEGVLELAFTADNRTSFDAATAAVYEANDVKFTIAKGASTNDLGDYNAPARIYQGCVATIECAGMTKIVFNVNSGKPVEALTNSIPESANYTVAVEGNVVTLTFTAPANSLEISAGAQFRLDSIVVYQ